MSCNIILNDVTLGSSKSKQERFQNFQKFLKEFWFDLKGALALKQNLKYFCLKWALPTCDHHKEKKPLMIFDPLFRCSEISSKMFYNIDHPCRKRQSTYLLCQNAFGPVKSNHVTCNIHRIISLLGNCVMSSVTRKKSPNVYKSCPKMISPEKRIILTP